MKTSIQTVAAKRFFVVDTEIPVVSYREGITSLAVVIEKDTDETFSMVIDNDADMGSISKFGVVANAEINGNFAILIPIPVDAKMEEIKVEYGSKLVAAKAGLELLKAQMAKEAADVDATFEGIEETDAE